jgi:glycosyltransferase involved in cell wall biosynthesis
MKPIKVLKIVNVETENYYLNNLVEYTDSNKVQFSFISFGSAGGFTTQMEKKGFIVHTLNAQGWVKKPAALLKLRRLMKQINPDIVHAHLFVPSFWGLTFAKWQNRKTVITRHHSDALYVIPSSVKRSIWLRLEKYINRKSDHIIAPSQMVYDIIVDKEKVPASKVSLIPYGQTTERFTTVTAALIQQTREELAMQNSISLVCVSRLFNRKGHQYLFDAFAALIKQGTNVTLYLVGTGLYKETLETLAAEKGIADKVKFLGWRNDALAIMAAADIMDTLDNGKYGVIVPPADAKAFEEGIQTIMAGMPAAKEKAIEGRRYLLEYMSAERVATAYTNIYQQLI